MSRSLFIDLQGDQGQMHLLRGTRSVQTVTFDLAVGDVIGEMIQREAANIQRLSGMPIRGARLMVLATPPHVQIRRLNLSHDDLAGRPAATLIAGCPERFFLATSETLLTAAARAADDGSILAAACDAALFSVVEEFAVSNRCTFAGIAITDTEPDGKGAAARDIADRFRAAPLLIINRTGRHVSQSVPLWRVALAGSVLATALTFAAAAPLVDARRRATAATNQLLSLAEPGARSAQLMTRLASSQQRILELRRFQASRRSVVQDLLTLATAMPAGSAILNLRVDSVFATIVAVAPRASALVAALDGMAGFTGAEIIGPVTRESAPVGVPGTQGSRELDRFTVRVRRTPAGVLRS